jgi:hypothetical protein
MNVCVSFLLVNSLYWSLLRCVGAPTHRTTGTMDAVLRLRRMYQRFYTLSLNPRIPTIYQEQVAERPLLFTQSRIQKKNQPGSAGQVTGQEMPGRTADRTVNEPSHTVNAPPFLAFCRSEYAAR